MDLGAIQDIITESIDGYKENTFSNGTDIRMNKNKYALWNGITGEIKTKIGECTGVGQENYGCNIWLILGQQLTQPVVDQAQFYIRELAPKYEEVKDITVKSIVKRHDGRLELSIYVASTLGDMEGDVIVG